MRTFKNDSSLCESNEPIEFLGASIPLYVESESNEGPTANQLAAVAAIERVGDRLMVDICRQAREYCVRVDDYVGLEDDGIFVDFERIADHFQFKSIAIPQLKQCQAVLYMVECDCDWEPEHSMQLVIEGEEVLYCGSTHFLFDRIQWHKWIELSPAERRQTLGKWDRE